MRHSTHTVRIGNVLVGSEHPVVVQSMTNTATEDIKATIQQVAELCRAGSELVRITVNTGEAARAVPAIREGLDKLNLDVPLVGDFHFNGHRLLTDYPQCAEALAKYRINPGNVGFGRKRDDQFAMIIGHAIEHGKPVLSRSFPFLEALLGQPGQGAVGQAVQPVHGGRVVEDELAQPGPVHAPVRHEFRPEFGGHGVHGPGPGQDPLGDHRGVGGQDDLVGVFEVTLCGKFKIARNVLPRAASGNTRRAGA